LKIRHDVIVDNVVTYVCAKFDDDRLWNEKALAVGKSDNNNTNTKKKNKTRTALVALGDPSPGLKNSALPVPTTRPAMRPGRILSRYPVNSSYHPIQSRPTMLS